jgi:adenylate cyclase
MFKIFQSRLELKILVLIIAILIVGFGSYVVINIQKESEALLKQHQEKLQLYSETVMAGIRNVMLSGKSPLASSFVNDARENLKFGSVTIYDRFGKEVLLREGEGVRFNVNDSTVNQVLSTHQVVEIKNTGNENMLSRYEPIRNRPECWRCHDSQYPLRGVLQLTLKSEAIHTSNDSTLMQMAGTIGEFIAAAFRTIMVGGKGDNMDTLMEAVYGINAINRIQVYNRYGDFRFGFEDEETRMDAITRFVEQGPGHYFEQSKKNLRMYFPLANQDRCQVCHGSNHTMRGVIVIDFNVDTLNVFQQDMMKFYTAALQQTAAEGLRSIMLVGKASSVRYYMDELRSLSILQNIRVFDRFGNEHFLTHPPRKRDELKEIIAKKTSQELQEKIGNDEHWVRLTPILNENRCHACHGSNHDVRAVVEVSASMKEINETIEANKLRSAGVGTLTIILVWVVIRFFMKSVVVQPVQIIEKVASRVGQGDFSAQTDVRSNDEIGSLAQHINDMVKGLRERFHLEKFVSQQTVQAVRSADEKGIRLGGERKVATVFFSDIRGFTSYSENVDPERVISMLNNCLSQQASIVKKYGGDVDKYVGDEMVAVFEEENMVERALRAALEIQSSLKDSLEEADRDIINIGIGINTGEMVMGAMGSPERMDYTVIGDNVNLGARLCSVAKGGQILISEPSAKHLTSTNEFRLTPLEPILVKGKEAPIKIYEVTSE